MFTALYALAYLLNGEADIAFQKRSATKTRAHLTLKCTLNTRGLFYFADICSCEQGP